MNEEELNKQLYLLQRYQEQAEQIYGEAELIEKIISEYERAIETLQEMGATGERDVLMPVGGNVFAYATLKDTGKVIVNVGRGVFIEKPVNAAVDIINRKIDDLKKSQEKLIKTAEEIRARMEEIGRKISEGSNVQVSEKKD